MKGTKLSWQPVMTADTAVPVYWLNWRVLLCGIWISFAMVIASYLIWKYEGSNSSRPDRVRVETQQGDSGALYEDEGWRPCLKDLHPAWLMAFRAIGFVVLLALLVANVVVDGGGIFYFYTQWTFTLVTIYFGLGSVLSVNGCYEYRNRVGGDHVELDAERGNYVAPRHAENVSGSNTMKSSVLHEHHSDRKPAGILVYAFQIIFQMSAGAVMLTDAVFWFIIVPFLTIKDYKLNFLLVSMHSINAVFLLADAALNSLQFPWFRFAYFILWTAIYVIFQWVIHACISLWWPYPFLDLSSSYAPLWYLAVGLMHIPCYGVFVLILRMKHFLWSKWFPESYHIEK
ncbi:uncharacterized protein LOC113300075 isoform X2 [Papaver somniferum]|uniref:uncharacterized protein LOC113300075 isoform X2 n=1 Tax=Papaver somniferum TaxID=3469 RepID=UPI000E6FA237|nr:uncharacterized protein LOC113300075 isoform X2 [Papaver somniferum]